MTKYVIDAYAWIEYFEGSEEGKHVQHLIMDEDNEIYTHAVTLAEVVSKMKRKRLEAEAAATALQMLSKILPADAEFCQEVGIAHAETRAKIPGFGLADAFVLVTGRRLSARIVTGDPHFRQVKGVMMLGGR